jgi:hypothetical protein
MAVTHQTDTEQRVIQMQFTRVGTMLKVQAPNHHYPHGMAARGCYMLFIVNSRGVPSEGRFADSPSCIDVNLVVSSKTPSCSCCATRSRCCDAR